MSTGIIAVACSQSSFTATPPPSATVPSTQVNATSQRIPEQAALSKGRKPHCVGTTCSPYNFPTLVGVALTVMGYNFDDKIFTAKIISDIQNNLGADYVRTQWVYDWWLKENGNFKKLDSQKIWTTEDQDLTPVCNAGMPIGIILPGPEEVFSAVNLYPGDGYGSSAELASATKQFFNKYGVAGTTVQGVNREACKFVYAELGSEENTPKSVTQPDGTGAPTTISVDSYAAYWGNVAPAVRAMSAKYGNFAVIPAGTSGISDTGNGTHLSGTTWTQEVAHYLDDPTFGPLPDSYGVDPYGILVANMKSGMNTMATAASTDGVTVSIASAGIAVPDIGMNDCDNEPSGCWQPSAGNHDMLDTLTGSQSLDGNVPFVSIYEYETPSCAKYLSECLPSNCKQYNVPCASGFDLKLPNGNNDNLHQQIYDDVQNAIAIIHSKNPALRRSPKHLNQHGQVAGSR